MKVKKWISYSETDNYIRHIWIFDDNGNRNEYFYALLDDLKTSGRKITGKSHQYSRDGVPLFEDGAVLTASWRTWGGVMARIWGEIEDVNYDYLDFYM